MDAPGKHTLPEINSQPAAWADALEQIFNRRGEIEALLAGPYEQVIFTGCGSTYYTALAAAAVMSELTGRTARALPASELWLNPAASYPRAGRILLVPVSRSGETSETLMACRAFQAAGRGAILTLSGYPQAPLASLGAVNLVLAGAQEESYAQTRAFTTLYLGALALACLAAAREDLLSRLPALPGACRRLLDDYGPAARALGRDLSIDRVYFLGSGYRYGLACELSMKMKEMSLTHCEPFHFLEFRHGPKTMASQGALVVGLLSGGNAGSEQDPDLPERAAQEQAVLRDVQAAGARVLRIGERDAEIPFFSGLPAILQGPLYLPAGQLLAYERALAKGLDPDRPLNLQPVIRLG